MSDIEVILIVVACFCFGYLCCSGVDYIVDHMLNGGKW